MALTVASAAVAPEERVLFLPGSVQSAVSFDEENDRVGRRGARGERRQTVSPLSAGVGKAEKAQRAFLGTRAGVTPSRTA